MEQAGDQGDQRKGGGLPGKRALAKPRDEEYVALTFPQRVSVHQKGEASIAITFAHESLSCAIS